MLAKAAVENGDILRLDLTVSNKGLGGGNNKDGGFGKMGGRRLQDAVVDMVTLPTSKMHLEMIKGMADKMVVKSKS